MKNLNFALLSLLLASCAQFQDAPKTVHFPYAADLLIEVQKNTGRAPAQVEVSTVNEKSPRRVYFSALYHQYLTLGQYLNKKNDTSFCPQFHHDRIETDAGLVPKVSLYQSSNIDSEGRDYFPELAFNKKFSLRDYHKVIKEELEILCEDGVSDNFYKFENLVTHYSDKISFHKDPTAMKSVLKIPVFANFYLVKMLEVQGFHSTSPEEIAFIKMTKTYWFGNYVSQASKVRNNFIKNKMVGR